MVMENKDSSEAITFSVPAGAILDTWSSDPWTNGVQIEQMEDMQKLYVDADPPSASYCQIRDSRLTGHVRAADSRLGITPPPG